MIKKNPHLKVPSLKWQYKCGDLTGWTRTRQEAAATINKINTRTKAATGKYKWEQAAK